MIYLRHCCPSHLRKLPFLSPNNARLMGSDHLLKPAPFNIVPTYPSSHTHQSHTHKRHLPVLCPHPNVKYQNHRYLLKNNVSPYSSHADVPSPVYFNDPEVKRSNLEALKLELEKIGVKNLTLAAGEKYRLLCPKVVTWRRIAKASLFPLTKMGDMLCGNVFEQRAGLRAFADSKPSDCTSHQHTQVKPIREIKDDGGFHYGLAEPSEQP